MREKMFFKQVVGDDFLKRQHEWWGEGEDFWRTLLEPENLSHTIRVWPFSLSSHNQSKATQFIRPNLSLLFAPRTPH